VNPPCEHNPRLNGRFLFIVQVPFAAPAAGGRGCVRGAMEARPGKRATHDQAADDIEQKKAQHHMHLAQPPIAEDGISVDEAPAPRRTLNNRTMSTQSTMSKASAKSVGACLSRVGGWLRALA
jgi:hypothetical protein